MPGACEKKEYLTPFEWQLRQVCALFTLEIVRSENLVTKCWEYLPALNKVGARRCLSPNRSKAENILNSHLFCIEYRNGENISHAYAANQYALRCKYVASCVRVCVCISIHTHTHICIYVVQIKWRQQARTILYLCKFISVTFPPLNWKSASDFPFFRPSCVHFLIAVVVAGQSNCGLEKYLIKKKEKLQICMHFRGLNNIFRASLVVIERG